MDVEAHDPGGPEPERMVCVWCPDWPVTAARRRGDAPTDRPVVVVEWGRVRVTSAEARALGVRPGMRRREAEACAPGVAVLDADPAADARAFEPVARAVEAFAPRLVVERPGLLWFPARGPSRYFGGDAALVERVVAAVEDAAGATGTGGVDARGGVAAGTFAARLAARRSVVVPRGGTAEFLSGWPVAVLAGGDRDGGDPAARPAAAGDLPDLLRRLGLRTLGAFAALPAAAVVARFGAAGLAAHRRAGGGEAYPPVPGTAPADWTEALELDPPVERVDTAVFVSKALAERFLDRLSSQGRACCRVVVEVETEHGERRSRTWHHEGALTPAALAERVRWQLEGWLSDEGGLTGGLTLLRLVPDQVVPASGRQLGFWGGDPAVDDRAARALARVQGMLGPGAVVTAVVQGGRTPAERVRWVPWGEPREPHPLRPYGPVPGPAGREAPPWPGALPGPAPARILDPPPAVELLDAAGRPVVVTARGEVSGAPTVLRGEPWPGGGGRRVECSAGPFAHDVRWWDRRARSRRAYWQCALEGGVVVLVGVARGRATLEAVYD